MSFKPRSWLFVHFVLFFKSKQWFHPEVSLYSVWLEKTVKGGKEETPLLRLEREVACGKGLKH